MLRQLSRPFRLAGQKYAQLSEQHPHKTAAGTAVLVMGSADLVCQKAMGGSSDVDYARLAGVTTFAGWHYGGPCKWLYLKYDEIIPRVINQARDIARGATAASSVSSGVVASSPVWQATPGTISGQISQAGIVVSGNRGYGTMVSSSASGIGLRAQITQSMAKVINRLPVRYRALAMTVFADVWVHTPFLLVPTFYLITGLAKNGFDFGGLERSVAQLRREWLSASFGSVAFWTPVAAANFALVPQHSRILVVTGCGFVYQFWLSYFSNRESHAAKTSSSSSNDEIKLLMKSDEETEAIVPNYASENFKNSAQTSSIEKNFEKEKSASAEALRVSEKEKFGTGVAAKVPLSVLYNTSTFPRSSLSVGNEPRLLSPRNVDLNAAVNTSVGKKRVSFGYLVD